MYVLPPQTNREFQIKTSPDKCSPKRLKEAIITEISSAPTSARRMLMVSIYNNGSNRKRGSTGWELYWIRHSGWSSFESRNVIITARKRFWHGLVWHLALLNCPHSLGCQPCHYPFAERSVKIAADQNRADSFLFIKIKGDEWIPQHICGGGCRDVKQVGDVWITNRCFSIPRRYGWLTV